MNKKLLLSLSVLCAGVSHERSFAVPIIPLVTSGLAYSAGNLGFWGGATAFVKYKEKNCKSVRKVVKAFADGAMWRLQDFPANIDYVVSPALLFAVVQKAAYALSPWAYVTVGLLSGATGVVGGWLTAESTGAPLSRKSKATKNVTRFVSNLAPAALYAVYMFCRRT